MSSHTSPTPVQTPNKALQVYEISSTQTLGRVLCWVFLSIINFIGKTEVLIGERIQSSSTKLYTTNCRVYLYLYACKFKM